MKRRSLHNRRWVAWLLSMAFVLMTLPSGASWQCLDGHPCPPGCTMQHRGGNPDAKGSASPHACCLPQTSANAGAAHCALCASARPEHAQIKERCTSPICVLRVQAKPDISTPAPVHFVLDFDTTAILLPVSSPMLVPEETASVSFGSPRAPPDRFVVRLHSPRAPPILL